MRVAVLVPRRADNGRRDRLWQWVRQRWFDEHPDWSVSEGFHDEGPFNRSAAINRAADGDWDIGIIADSDSFVGKEQIEASVARCVTTGQMTLAYDRWNALDAAMSDRVMAGYRGDWTEGLLASLEGSCSSMVVVTRAVWDECGGFDEGFVGWGSEDIAFSHMAQTFGGGLQRIPGPVWHLWHESSDRPCIDTNVARADLYHAAAYDREAMHALMDRLR